MSGMNQGIIKLTLISDIPRSRWLIESPQKLVPEHRLPQIPVWFQVSDSPLTEEKADPIRLNDILGSVFIYLGGISFSCALLGAELIAKTLTDRLTGLHTGKNPRRNLATEANIPPA